MKSKSKITGGLVLAWRLAIIGICLAQTSEATADSIVSIVADAQGLELVPAEKVPRSGTFWLMQPGRGGGIAVPLPCPPTDTSLPIYAIAEGQFLVGSASDGQTKNAAALAAQAETVANLIDQVQTEEANRQTRAMASFGAPGFGDDADGTNYYSLNGLCSIEDYETNLWIAQTHITNGWLAGIGSNTLADVEYEIQSKTNLLQSDWFSEGFFLGSSVTNWTPFSVLQGGRTNLFIRLRAWADDGSGMPIWWQWQHFGHGGVNPNDDPDGDGRSNLQEYQAGSNPLDLMVIAWGNNSYGQCDVPIGLTNAIAVAAGGVAYGLNQGFSLALRDNGTVVAWGNHDHGQTNIPSGLTNVVAIAAGVYHGLALRKNGTVSAWGAWWASDVSNNVIYPAVTVPSGLTNVIAVAAGSDHDLALRLDGSVVAWGYYTNADYVKVPTNLQPAKAVTAGWEHSVALRTNGTVVAWGYDDFGALDVPSNLSNVVAIAAGENHTLALKSDGKVVAWGNDNYFANFWGFNQGQSTVPTGLSNVVAIAAGGFHSMALKSDGTVVMWGNLGLPGYPLNQIVGIASGETHALALRGGRLTPIMVAQPTNQAVLPGATVLFSAQALVLAGTTYQWQSNSVNISGATNATLTLASVTTNSQGLYRVVISNGGAGSVVSSNATLTVFDVTPPVITSKSTPTNRVCIYGNRLYFNVGVTAHGQTNGWPIHYQWQFNGTNIANANSNSYGVSADDNSTGIFSVLITNAVGATNTSWQVTVTNAINVTNDLLLIYNTNSADSTTVLNYYLSHRPNVGGANVLGVGWTNPATPGYFETITQPDLTNQILNPVVAWLTNNPSKRPQYVILFMDLPGRVNTNCAFPTNGYVEGFPIVPGASPSVSVQFQSIIPDWQPYVTHLNMGMTNTVNRTNDCIAYINKLAAIGVPISSNSPVLSASANEYGNTNFILDNVRFNTGDEKWRILGFYVSLVTNSLLTAGIADRAIHYCDGLITNSSDFLNTPHITNMVNVAGYLSWGAHGGISGDNTVSGAFTWNGNSGWWIINTLDSYNGHQVQLPGSQESFTDWFSQTGFGGTDYSNTPVGAVTTVDEPGLSRKNDSSVYFGLWASGKNFGICAWNSVLSEYFQAVGDPLVVK